MALRSFLTRYAPPPELLFNRFGNRLPLQSWRLWLASLLGVTFAAPGKATLMWRAEIWSARRLRIGRGTIVGPQVLLDARGGITLGDSVNVSGYVRMMSAKHDVDDPGFAAVFEPIVIGDRVWIGIGATILGGVTIGEGAVVAANATVTKDVEPFTIVAGTPARKVRDRSRELDYELDYRPNWL
jgi:putative colanic acid biosynthesis acetyltransferase WcaF